MSNDLIISQFKQQSAGNFNKGDKKANNEANQNEAASPVKRRSTSQMDVRRYCFSMKLFLFDKNH